jgi:NhaP-type Na+/H+ or K+/H+ antiporter
MLPLELITALTLVGALAFGIVVGWVTGGTLRRTKRTGLTDLSTLIGIIGGAAITALFKSENGSFGAYCIGLALGLFYYINRATRPGAPDWLGEAPGGGGGQNQGGIQQQGGLPKGGN